MQKIVNLRASQGDLDDALDQFVKDGWKIISVTRGSEWSRVGFSYNWTIVLEGSDDTDAQEAEKKVEEVRGKMKSRSIWVTVTLVVGLLVLCGVIFGIMFSTLG